MILEAADILQAATLNCGPSENGEPFQDRIMKPNNETAFPGGEMSVWTQQKWKQTKGYGGLK